VILAAELTAPALFVAGATTSLHCALMCGAVNAAQARSRGAVPLRQALALVHGGRVLGYALLGALAGALGGRLALWLPAVPTGTLQLLAALALIAAGVQQIRDGGAFPRSKRCCVPSGNSPPSRVSLPPRGRLLAQGLLWALMPCGILYTVVLLAGLTTHALSGALLLAAFGLGTVPLMGASGGLLGLATRPRAARGLRQGAGALLMALGVTGVVLASFSHDALAALLCG